VEEVEEVPDVVDGQQIEKAAESSEVPAKISMKYNIRAHFDSVRGVHYS